MVAVGHVSHVAKHRGQVGTVGGWADAPDSSSGHQTQTDSRAASMTSRRLMIGGDTAARNQVATEPVGGQGRDAVESTLLLEMTPAPQPLGHLTVAGTVAAAPAVMDEHADGTACLGQRQLTSAAPS